jgi:hypothetical protein
MGERSNGRGQKQGEDDGAREFHLPIVVLGPVF